MIDIRLAWVFWFAIGRGDGKIYFPEIEFVWRGFFRRGTFFKERQGNARGDWFGDQGWVS